MLGQCGKHGGKPHFCQFALGEHRQHSANELVLLPLQHERIRHFAFEQANVESGDQFAGGAIAKLKQRRLESARGIRGEGLRFEAKIGKHFQRRRMNRRGALILDRLRLRLDEQYRNAFADQGERGDSAHRSGADDNHALFIVGHDSIYTLAISNVER